MHIIARINTLLLSQKACSQIEAMSIRMKSIRTCNSQMHLLLKYKEIGLERTKTIRLKIADHKAEIARMDL